MQSESETVGSFTFAVLGKAADGQYRHTLRGGFFQKCLKSSPRRGLYFSARTIKNPHKNDIARANVYLTSIVIRQITKFQLHLRALKYEKYVPNREEGLQIVLFQMRGQGSLPKRKLPKTCG